MPTATRNTTYDFYSIGSVDPTYKNIWGFTTRAEREAFLTNYHQKTISNVAYWKPGNPIRANFSTETQFSFESSFTYDYVKITNRSNDSNQVMVYYAFITEHTYLNANLTQLTLDIDWVQTFYWNESTPWWNRYAYVAYTNNPHYRPMRGTASDLPIQARVSLWKWRQSVKSNFCYVIFSSVDLTTTSITWLEDVNQYSINWAYLSQPNPKDASSVVDGMFMGTRPYLISCPNDWQTRKLMEALMGDLNAYGQIGSITGVYTVHKAFFNHSAVDIFDLTSGPQPYNQTITVSVPDPDTLFSSLGINVVDPTLKGYNNTYIEVCNHNGETVRYTYEDFTGAPTFLVTITLAAGYPVMTCIPGTNFLYGASELADLFVMKVANPLQCSLLVDNYLIWKAQNQNSIAAGIDAANLTVQNAKEAQSKSGGIATMLDKLFDDAGDALGGMFSGLGLSSDQLDALTSGAYGSINGLLSQGAMSSLGMQASYVYKQQTSVAEQALRNVQAQMQDMQYTPASLTGSNAYGDFVLYDQYGFTINVVGPYGDIAAKADMDLSVLGHLQNTGITITRGRQIWDYWRCYDPRLVSNPAIRPAFVVKLMVDIMSKGFNLWWPDANHTIPRNIFGRPWGTLNPVYNPS